jgi:hypothetical protein
MSYISPLDNRLLKTGFTKLDCILRSKEEGVPVEDVGNEKNTPQNRVRFYIPVANPVQP